MLVVLLGLGAAYFILHPSAPRSAGQGGPNRVDLSKVPKNVGSTLLGSPGRALPASTANSPGSLPDGLSAEQICGFLAGQTAKAVGLSDAQAAKVAAMPSYLTQPICYANLKVMEWGVQEGKQAYDYVEDKVSGGYQTVKGWASGVF